MFVGHYAPALAAATHSKSPGLGTLFVAAQLVDFGFFGLVLADVEHLRIVPGITAMNRLDLYDMPYTHSLVGSLAWAAGFAALVWLLTRNRTGALIAGAVVFSHWLLDLLVHRPDLTLAGSPPAFGLGLWNVPAVAMPLEAALIAAAFGFYALHTRPKAQQGTIALWLLAALLILFQAIDWFGPPPEEATAAMALTALLAYSLAALVAWWAGRNRELRNIPRAEAAAL